MYLCPLSEVIGKLPVMSVEIIPCSVSNLIVWAQHCGCGVVVGVLSQLGFHLVLDRVFGQLQLA